MWRVEGRDRLDCSAADVVVAACARVGLIKGACVVWESEQLREAYGEEAASQELSKAGGSGSEVAAARECASFTPLPHALPCLAGDLTA